MISKIISLMVVSFATVVFGLAGCGGGGGGAGTSVSYKGNTTQAAVNGGNAKVLSVDAIQGTQNASAVGVLGKSVAGTQDTSPNLLTIAGILEESIIIIHSKSTAAKTVALTQQGTMYGYSGALTYSGDFNESTGTFIGTISFNQYRELSNTATISGNISFSGVYNLISGTFTSLNITMTNLQGVQGTDSFILNGSMSSSITGSTKNLSMSVVIIKGADNSTYWHKDFSLALTGNSMTVSGTYYDYVHGYVVISTVTPLTVSSYSTKPTSGQLLFTGSNGTKARLTYTNSGHILEVDAAGNNTYVGVP